MNILHHKSWHVRTKQNIERVRRDEEKAAKEEEERKTKIALAEQEARTDLLRSRAKGRLKDTDSLTESADGSSSSKKLRHINFFSSAEAGVNEGGNVDREKEKKEEQEKLEKNIGLLKYLHEPVDDPWYLKSRSKEDKKLNRKKLAQTRSLNFLDPLSKMNKDLTSQHKQTQRNHAEKRDRKAPKSETKTATSRKSKTIEQLRAERLKREREERSKTERFLRQSQGEIIDKPNVEFDDRTRRYNSQFNPEFSRQSR